MEEFSKLMASTLNPDFNIRGEAERTLNGVIMDVGLMDLIFKYITDPNINLNLKQAAAVFLMKYIKDFWFDDTEKALSEPHKVISCDVKAFFQNNILNLMFYNKVDPKVLPTLKNAIIHLCDIAQGYNNTWPELIVILGDVLKSKDYSVSVEVYDLIQKIIKRYRTEFKSRPLFAEIIKTIDHIAVPLTEDGLGCLNYLMSNQISNLTVLNLKMLHRILNIFISLNAQDFPEFFEDNLENWYKILKATIDLNLNVNENDLHRLFIKVKKIGMKALNFYCEHYYDDFMQYHDNFLPSVWNLFNIIKQEQKYEKLIKQLLDYYQTLFKFNRANAFDPNTIQHLINNLIIPEMKLTSKELDDYEDNPINFIKIELEEIDMDSNKHHAINLLKCVLVSHPNLNEQYLGPTINNLLSNYYQNTSKNWMQKIIAINLIFATMIKTFSQRIGATDVKVTQDELTNLIQTIFIKEFNQVQVPHQIARIYSLKFLSTFRLQIPAEWLTSTIKMLVDILKQSDNVVQTASLLTLEKILFMRDIQTNNALAKNAVNNQETFVDLVDTLVKFSSASINIFAMRCLFRTIYLTSEDYYQFVIENLANSINEILKIVIANPSEDQFNYFLFETIAMLMRKLNRVNVSLYDIFESKIKGNLLYILENFLTDLIGYVIQILSLHLDLKQGDPMTDELHRSLLNSVLFQEINWTLAMKYMFNPFAAYLKTSFTKFKNFYLSNVNVNITALFKIFDKLLELKNYSIVFDLLDGLLSSFEMNYLLENLKQLIAKFLGIYNSLKENNKKAFREFSKILLVFFAKIVIKSNAKYLVEIIEGASQGATVHLLFELSDNLIDLDRILDKKLVTYMLCSIMLDFHSNFDNNLLRHFIMKLIEHCEKFMKFNLSTYAGNMDKLIEFGQDLSYAANNYNKLINAEIKVENPDYLNINNMDQNGLLFETNDKIKNLKNVDLISEVYDTLKDKEKQFIQNKSKEYIK